MNVAPCGVNAGCAFKLILAPAKTVTEPVKSIVGGSATKQEVWVALKVLEWSAVPVTLISVTWKNVLLPISLVNDITLPTANVFWLAGSVTSTVIFEIVFLQSFTFTFSI